MGNFRADGLNDPFSINSGIGCTWDAVERLCEESPAVESYGDDDGHWIKWVGEKDVQTFTDPQAALIAIGEMTGAG